MLKIVLQTVVKDLTLKIVSFPAIRPPLPVLPKSMAHWVDHAIPKQVVPNRNVVRRVVITAWWAHSIQKVDWVISFSSEKKWHVKAKQQMSFRGLQRAMLTQIWLKSTCAEGKDSMVRHDDRTGHWKCSKEENGQEDLFSFHYRYAPIYAG